MADLNLDYEAERDLINALLSDASQYWEVAAIVTREHFVTSGRGESTCAEVFATIGALLSEGAPVDVGHVRDRLRSTGKIQGDADATVAMLRFLYDDRFPYIVRGGDAVAFARTVRDQALRRAGLVELDTGRKALQGGDPNVVLPAITARLSALTETQPEPETVTLEAAAMSAIDAKEDPDRAFLPTGYLDLDKGIRGYRRGELIVIAGRPYVGKTLFTLGGTCRMGIVSGYRTLFISLEMSSDALGETALLFSSGLTGAEFNGSADLPYLRRLAAEKLGKVPVSISRRHRVTADEVPGILRRARATGFDVVVFDNLHLMEHEGSRRMGSRVQELAAITRALKVGAAETGLVVIAISHLNRSADLRDDHRPVLADLRDSGTIEQDADVVAFLHRPDYYQTPRPGVPPPTSVPVELIVRKRRGGTPAVVSFLFFPSDCSFRPASRLSEAG